MTTLVPTPEQSAILESYLGSSTSLMIQALAGCSKTTMLEMLARAKFQTSALALAFNVKNKKDLELRFPPSFTVLTLNGLGHKVWSGSIGRRCEVDDKKLGRLLTTLAKQHEIPLYSDEWAGLRTLLSAAQTFGLVPSRWEGKWPGQSLLPDTPESWSDLATEKFLQIDEGHLPLLRAVLNESIKESYQGIISYDDQIYCSALFTSAYPKFPLVFVDEAQDLSTLNAIQVRKASSGRLVIVGDKLQSLYAFRGADSNSMENLRSLQDSWIDLPLATTFRCPHVVVERQQGHALGFKAWPSNPPGEFLSWLPEDRDDPFEWTWSQLEPLSGGDKIAVLCRNNAPLLSLAFRLIREGVGVMMQGRDIGKGLVALSKKILKEDELGAQECVGRVREWLKSESALARANDHEEKIAALTDRAECLLACLEAEAVRCAKDLRLRLTNLFSRDSGKVLLSTIHRAKGLEWHCVVLLDPWRIPSKWALRQRGSALQQELNARYVAETRAKHTLIHANLEHFI